MGRVSTEAIEPIEGNGIGLAGNGPINHLLEGRTLVGSAGDIEILEPLGDGPALTLDVARDLIALDVWRDPVFGALGDADVAEGAHGPTYGIRSSGRADIMSGFKRLKLRADQTRASPMATRPGCAQDGGCGREA